MFSQALFQYTMPSHVFYVNYRSNGFFDEIRCQFLELCECFVEGLHPTFKCGYHHDQETTLCVCLRILCIRIIYPYVLRSRHLRNDCFLYWNSLMYPDPLPQRDLDLLDSLPVIWTQIQNRLKVLVFCVYFKLRYDVRKQVEAYWKSNKTQS